MTCANRINISSNYLFYLSTPPNLYEVIPEMLSKVGLNSTKNGFKRLIIEKPFGSSLDSARNLTVISLIILKKTSSTVSIIISARKPSKTLW